MPEGTVRLEQVPEKVRVTAKGADVTLVEGKEFEKGGDETGGDVGKGGSAKSGGVKG